MHNVVVVNIETERLAPTSIYLKGLNFCILNAQSRNNKAANFSDYICDRKPDLVALTKTWFTDKESASRALCTPTGYKHLETIHVLVAQPVVQELFLEATLLPLKLLLLNYSLLNTLNRTLNLVSRTH